MNVINVRLSNSLIKFYNLIKVYKQIRSMKEKNKDLAEEIARRQKFGKLTINNLSKVSKKKLKAKKCLKKKSRKLFLRRIRTIKSCDQLLRTFSSQYRYSRLMRSSAEDINKATTETNFPTEQAMDQIPRISSDIVKYLSLCLG